MPTGIPARSMLLAAISFIIVFAAFATPSLTQAQVYPFGPGPIYGQNTAPQQPQVNTPVYNASVSVGCVAPSIHSFTPHIYDGELHSFDYFVDNQPGVQYVPGSVVINGKAIDLRYATVWKNVGPNRVKIHVDVPYFDLGGDLSGPVSINTSVLQVPSGTTPIYCPSAASFSLTLPYYNVPTAPSSPTTPSTPSVPSTPSTPSTPAQPQQPQEPGEPEVPVTPGTTTNGGETGGGTQCVELSSWWLLTLILLDIIVSAVLLLYMSIIVKTNARLIAAVLIPPLVFIGLWYFLNTCHTHIWFPIIAVLLGIGVLTASGSPETFDPILDRTRDHLRSWWRRVKEIFSSLFGSTKRTTALIIPPAPQQKKPPVTPPANLPGEKAGEKRVEKRPADKHLEGPPH